MGNRDEFDRLIADRQRQLRNEAEQEAGRQQQAAEETQRARDRQVAYCLYAAQQLLAANVEQVHVTAPDVRQNWLNRLLEPGPPTFSGWTLRDWYSPKYAVNPDRIGEGFIYEGQILCVDGGTLRFEVYEDQLANTSISAKCIYGSSPFDISEAELTDLLARKLPDRSAES